MFTNLEQYMLPCLTKSILGFDCLGCGLQRSVLYLLQGEFTLAYKMYPAIYSLLFLFFVVLGKRFINSKKRKKLIQNLAYFNISVIMISYIVKHIN